MSNLIELARRLHEEKLFVKSEQDTILKLNEQVRLNAEKLSHSFWITRNHYLNLNQLIGNVSSGNPASCSQRANQLEKVQFINANEELGYEESSKYGQFLEAFINNPTLAAACLEYGDILSLESTAEVAQTIVLGCYGNSIITDNHKHLLELLEALLLLQIADDEQPRRLVQKGRCAFSVVYNLFAESLMPGKLFLMSALHQPIMKVLMDDELHLETDQVKILESLNEMEITKRFGRRTSDCFTEKLSQYIKQNEKFLAEICSMFVKNLVQAMASFPQSLGWVIARAYHIVKDARIVSADEAKALSADFLLQHFICPAIVDPERYGITGNVPVTKIARANLMQVAQVLQMAAHAKVPTPQNGQLDLMDQVKITMKDLIDVVISTCNAEGAPESKNVHGHVTSAVFLTSTQIAQFVLFLRQIQLSNVKGVDQSSLEKILAYLPRNPPESITRATNVMLNQSYEEEMTPVKRYSGASRSSPAASMMKSKTSTFDSSSNSSPSTSAASSQYSSSPSSGRKIFSKHLSKSKLKSPLKQAHHHHHKEFDMLDEPDSSLNVSSTSQDHTSQHQANEEKVLVITINNNDQDSSCVIPGTLSETEVLQIHRNNCTNTEQNTTVGSSESLDIENGLEKQSQFSLYLGGSNLSEIGELGAGADESSGASDRSPSGSRSDNSIDMDQSENGVGVDDNSSFIAGGSSHGGNQDEDDMEEAGDMESVKRSSNDEALKDLRRKIPTSRESIEDKMRKFEIRKMGASSGGVRGGADGAGVSNTDTRSETWSVDVYASDSEQTNEQSESQHERLREIAVDPADHIRRSSTSMGSLLSGGVLGRGGGDEDSRSDIWSVEVLASDSEPPDNQSDYRLQDLDSEAASSVNVEDPSEDNRSRASTPGLSAASGYSAISGLSLISDHQKNELPTAFHSGGVAHMNNLFEQTKSSQQQQATSSSSADAAADELVTPTNQQQSSKSTSITRAASDASSKIREKSVAWNLPTQQQQQDGQQQQSSSSGEQVDDMMESSGTIKRSPYKRIPGGGKNNNNSRIPRVTPAWYDTSSNQADATVVSNELADLREFDPFASTPPPAPTTDMMSSSPGGHLLNQSNSTSYPAPLTSQSPSSLAQQQKSTAAVTTERQVGSGDSKSSNNTPNTLLKGINQFLSANSTDSQEQLGGAVRMAAGTPGNKSIERKKSWWKTGKFYKKSNSTVAAAGKSPIPSSSGGKPTRFGDSHEIFVDSLVSVSESPVVRSPGEDIMEKYMRKMTSTSSLISSLTITDEMRPKHQQQYNNEISRIGGDKIALISGSSQAPPSNSSATTSGSGDHQYWQQQQQTNNNKKEQQQNTKEQRRNDAKRKLRIVLSMAEPRPELPSAALLLLGVSADRSVMVTSGANELYGVQMATSSAVAPPTSSAKEQVKIRDQILSFVQAQLSQALVLQDSLRVAQLCEVKRCFSTIDNSMCRTIYQDLWREYNQRSAYIAYLVRARQHLLTASSYFRNIQQCIENDKTVCRRYFTHQCVRLFLKQRESRVEVFTRQFLRLVALDDKVSKIGEFLRELYGLLVADPMWEGTSEEEFNEAKCCIERFLFTSVYRTAMFPNGDADLSRDQLYREHITRLSASVTPSHPALQISTKYSFECPWQAAQVEARSIVTYRTPRGKLAAALRCCKTIMYLLKMADENEAPGADDFTPVLVYVLIMANPRHLLSTIQFVTAYIGDDLQGEDSYWWMQFTAATEFIKTIDERMK